MTSHRPWAGWLLILIALGALLIAVSTACEPQATNPKEETAVAQLLTVQPQIALTLTAWPTPPPLLTRPPTPTTEPRPLWTALPPVNDSLHPTATPPLAETRPATTVLPPVGSNPPAVRLIIPSLGLDAPVVEVSWDVILEGETWRSVWQTADGAAGHHRNSANPGEAGNVVISGHHNTRGEVFRQVSEIGQPGTRFDIGDEIILVAADGRQYTYTVVRWERFPEEGLSAAERRAHARYLDPTTDAVLTLVTCWPYESNSHRVVVVARLE